MNEIIAPRARRVSALLTPVVVCAAVVALATGCSKSSKNTGPEVPVPPTPNTPLNAVALLRWCWEQRSPTVYGEVFTGDFLYDFAAADSQSIGTTLNRAEELAIAENLFSTGVPGRRAATGIAFRLDSNLMALPDDRPGKNATWHQRVVTSVRLVVTAPDQSFSTVGNMVFYVTRGDSAQIPAELVARGFAPDPNRWYVDHWTDQTSCAKACVTVGQVKLAYAEGPVAPALARRR